MKNVVESNTEIENRIYDALNDNEGLWHSVNEVASVTGITSNDIFKTINDSDKFVLSSNEEKQPIITTRKRFRKEEPFLRKLVGAFKNRID